MHLPAYIISEAIGLCRCLLESNLCLLRYTTCTCIWSVRDLQYPFIILIVFTEIYDMCVHLICERFTVYVHYVNCVSWDILHVRASDLWGIYSKRSLYYLCLLRFNPKCAYIKSLFHWYTRMYLNRPYCYQDTWMRHMFIVIYSGVPASDSFHTYTLGFVH